MVDAFKPKPTDLNESQRGSIGSGGKRATPGIVNPTQTSADKIDISKKPLPESNRDVDSAGS